MITLNVSRFEETILPNSKKLLLYRIIQEQLNNIIKHANATEVYIELFNLENNCELLIRDNGIGAQLSNRKDGLGLKNIRNRVEVLNGDVEFVSSQGNGFCMQICFAA